MTDSYISNLVWGIAERRAKDEMRKAIRDGRLDVLFPAYGDNSQRKLTMDGVLESWSSRERK